ncbi:unnamed protein product, partial [marine sediment metagenome]
MAFRERLNLSRQKAEFVYSIFILIIIPLLVIANTFILTQSVRNTFNRVSRQEAHIINSVLGRSIKHNLDQPELIQSILEDIDAEFNVEIEDASVLVPVEDGKFEIIASNKKERIGQKVYDHVIGSAVSNNRAIGTEAPSKNNPDQNVWLIVSPIFDGQYDADVENINNSFTSLEQTDVDPE